MYASRNVFVTGGTGYIGRRVIPLLLEKGHVVRALVRRGSEDKAPRGCDVVGGNPLDSATFRSRVTPSDTLLQLVGTPHPSPRKAQQFKDVDLVSVRESLRAALASGVEHFVYVSVAQPSSVMKEYQAVRAAGESMIRESGLRATFLRPWYVLGPGHYWPYALLPFYWLAERIPATRDSARRLGLVTLSQFIQAIARAVETPPPQVRIVDVPMIKSGLL
ncbi:MAG TPA: NAD(P)H-binding protein [Gemmatimonadales bacterium]|jgi:uncharacterized protein YbjT (DUF2867 family)